MFYQERVMQVIPFGGLQYLVKSQQKQFLTMILILLIIAIDLLIGILDSLFETQPSQNVIYKNLYVKEITINSLLISS